MYTYIHIYIYTGVYLCIYIYIYVHILVSLYVCKKIYILHKVSQPPEPACKSGTSPQVQNQSASPEPVRNQSGTSHHTHPIFQPINKKRTKVVQVILENGSVE